MVSHNIFLPNNILIKVWRAITYFIKFKIGGLLLAHSSPTRFRIQGDSLAYETDKHKKQMFSFVSYMTYSNKLEKIIYNCVTFSFIVRSTITI